MSRAQPERMHRGCHKERGLVYMLPPGLDAVLRFDMGLKSCIMEHICGCRLRCIGAQHAGLQQQCQNHDRKESLVAARAGRGQQAAWLAATMPAASGDAAAPAASDAAAAAATTSLGMPPACTPRCPAAATMAVASACTACDCTRCAAAAAVSGRSAGRGAARGEALRAGAEQTSTQLRRRPKGWCISQHGAAACWPVLAHTPPAGRQLALPAGSSLPDPPPQPPTQTSPLHHHQAHRSAGPPA